MKGFIEFPGNKVYELIAAITDEHKAQWGTMSAHHMLEHLQLPLQFSSGKFDVPLDTPPEKVERIKKMFLLSEVPLKHDFPAPFLTPGLQELKTPTLAAAKESLLKDIEYYLNYWEQNQQMIRIHPVFGPLNREEWIVFHRKHFTHHFTQFALLGT